MKKPLQLISLLVLGSFILAACVSAFSNGGFASNGERIYFTATNENGQRIRYTGGPGGGGMMGASLACASCHGPDGRGGQRVIHMRTINAPDIRYEALSDEEGEHGEEGHGGTGTYDLETFRKAVVEGQHPDGERLDSIMPRWQLRDEDLADLLEYLKTLP